MDNDQAAADAIQGLLTDSLNATAGITPDSVGDPAFVTTDAEGGSGVAPAAPAPAPDTGGGLDFMPTGPDNPFAPAFGGGHHQAIQASFSTDEPTTAAMALMNQIMGTAPGTPEIEGLPKPAVQPPQVGQPAAQPAQAQPQADEPAEEPFEGKLDDVFADPVEDAGDEADAVENAVFQLSQGDAARIHADPALRGLGRTMLQQYHDAQAEFEQERQAWADEKTAQEQATQGMRDLITAIRTPEGFRRFLHDSVRRPQGQNLVYAAFQGAFADPRGNLRPEATDILLEVGMADPELFESVAEQLKTFAENPAEATQWKARRDLNAERRQLQIDRELHLEQVTTAEMARADTALRRMAKDAGLFQSTIDVLAKRLTSRAPDFYDQKTGGIAVPQEYLEQIVAEESKDQERYVRVREREAMEDAAKQAQSRTRKQATKNRTQNQRRIPKPVKGKRTTAVQPTTAPAEGSGVGPMMDWALGEEFARQAAAQN